MFIGFGSTGSPAELAALSAFLSAEPAGKWLQGTSPLAAAIPTNASVKPVFLPYSDATLVGLLVQGETAEAVKTAGTAAVSALKSAGSAKASDLTKAIAKAKFAAANALETRDGLVSVLGSKVCTAMSSTNLVSLYAIRSSPALMRQCKPPCRPSISSPLTVSTK